jgi:PhnB protein
MTQISLMLAVDDAARAADWYGRALGAAELWSLGSVIGLEIEGAPFFLHEPTATGFASPAAIGETTVRVEVFVDDPDTLFRQAIEAGADASTDGVVDHELPWGVHRQGSFRDPFGHTWHVGDRSPLQRFPQR